MEARSGLVLVDKPAGPSSFGVLRELRAALGRKLGHAGTLDPFATGLLLVLAGGATRLAAWLSGLDKEYTATLQLGAVSTTLDPEGELTATGARTDEESLRRAAAALRGELLQRVPLASAVKVDGERSYARLRRGQAVEAAARPVRIERLDVLAFDAAAQRAHIAVRCSKGTYVRQIAADLGEATGAGAYCLELRREAIGPFSVAQAGSLADVLAEPHGRWFLPPARALPHLPLRRLDDVERERVRHGRPIEAAGESRPTRLLFGDELVAVAEPGEGGLRPVAVFAR